MKRRIVLAAGLLVLPGITLATTPPKYNYPTKARAEYIFGCMHRLGGENYDTLYKCSCSIDYIANQISYDDYVTLDTYFRGQHAGGERPEVLREGRLAGRSRQELAALKRKAADQCLIDTGKSSQNRSDDDSGKDHG